MSYRIVRQIENKRFNLLSAAITAAVGLTATTSVKGLDGMRALDLLGSFVFAGSGTSGDAYVQTSFDSGTNWIDIAQFNYSGGAIASGLKFYSLDDTAVTTQYAPTSGTLTDNTVKNGVLGDELRVQYVTVGTYTGGVLTIYGVSKA